MSELNRELKEYLSRSGSSSEDKASLLPVTIKDLPSWGSWFKSNRNNVDDSSSTSSGTSSSWFSDAQNDPCCPSLGRKQRILGFFTCIVLGITCFTLAGFYAPLLVIKARKFSLLFTLGSLFSVMSFALLWGPVNYMRYMCSTQRIMFTLVYISSLFGTLYFALSIQSTILTSVAAIVQVVSLICFIISNIPGGQTGLKFMSSICSSIVKKSASKLSPV